MKVPSKLAHVHVAQNDTLHVLSFISHATARDSSSRLVGELRLPSVVMKSSQCREATYALI